MFDNTPEKREAVFNGKIKTQMLLFAKKKDRGTPALLEALGEVGAQE
jgi:hypothetical protein